MAEECQVREETGCINTVAEVNSNLVDGLSFDHMRG
jgi:hypothetical protein